ncbi:HNH endonuclease signature motif containing protein [Alteromonas macleodii]|uniref:HNH endonuclease family protein n=1 Tax=Alteromonas macleodii TaxID=28108 RepID=A0AB36FQC6_ALTMA|nr:HNH endonuclease signature motif containing protein [Alteromonas macleodii]OES24499.1 HNH endonuclease family protein [Alteromonas macleodii]OES25556.1 HNH endonuclease family protein [Alteromonas macleodii]OES25857.1 HNH endonuclease family protein [Alteromonas macleodii]OES38621.1 HNH endonuclease family protein [Alteromonas macleodii]
MTRFKYEAEHLEFLKTQFPIHRIPALTVLFNQRFNLAKTEAQIKACLKNNKFTCGRKPGFNAGENTKYSDEQIEWLKTNYPLMTLKQLVPAFNATFDLSETESQVYAYLKNHKITCGRTGQFAKGFKPWNTGKKGLQVGGRSAETQFKKGNIPANVKPLGHERICSQDGYILIKVEESNPYTGASTRYKHKHIVLWEAEYGPVPDDHVIIFKDGNKLHCELSNLECISRRELVRLNKLQLSAMPEELRPVIRSIAKLQVKQAELENKE